MTVAELMTRLRSLEVRLSADGERLRCSAPKGVLSDELRAELAAHKAEILASLRAENHREDTVSAGAGHEPLSFAQQRLWFIDQLQPGGFAYNITGGIRIRGALDVGALERSLGELVRRHEPLRTVFAAVDGHPVQIVTPPGEFQLGVVDLPPGPAATREEEAERLMADEGRRAFDLRRGPLFRARLMRFSPDEHVLQLTMHHIVADGWSLGVLSRDLTRVYQTQTVGGGDLAPVPIRYADLARRQRQQLRGDRLETQAAYWRDRLTPPPPVLELPGDRPRPAMQTFNGAVESFLVPAALAEALGQLSRENGVTLFMTLLAAFDVLLHRYTGASDIAVGIPIANRTATETEGMIGLFANSLVLRTDLVGDPTFRELLRRVRDVALGAYAHQDLPFERLVEMVQPARDMSHSPLFQVIFILQNTPFEAIELGGLMLSHVEIRTGSAKTDLTLEVLERPEGLRVALEYNTDLFEAETIRRLGNHLERLLAGVVADPEQCISRLPLLGEAERRRIATEWNATDSPAGGVAPRLFESQAARVPGAPAVTFEGRQMTYRELNRSANRLAQDLSRHGVGPDVLVGVFVERSVEMLVAVLAVLKAGGGYVPLDPGYPADRLEFMLQDAGIPLVITQERLLDRIAMPEGVRTICVDRDAGIGDREPDGDDPGGQVGPHDLAYVIYTSGSTGRPKGVQITHGALANVLAAFRETPGLTPRDVLVAVTTLSFDIAGLELLLPLVTGAQVVIASREQAADPAKLMALIAEAGATIVQATPATWRMLLEAGWRDADGLRILCGGEALPPELAARLLATGASVWNVYGPTETTIWSTIHRVDGHDGQVPIGRPIANTRTYVLDAGKELAPIGVPGELYIGGAGVARGYLNRPELTAEKFVRDPFSSDPDARLYRTGDIVRYRADGTLEYLGRADHQVKVRGFRIELGEIETSLAQHPAVAEAVVVARDGRAGDRYLAAYLRPAGAEPSGPEYRAFLKERLPDYMIPSTFTLLDAFPLTPNGKIDRSRLPEPDGRRPTARAPFLAPRSEIEQGIERVWRDVLRLEEVGVDDNFFDLGGHSLLLVQVQAGLRTVLAREVSIIEMFQYPTIRAMSAYLARQKTAVAG